MSTKEKITTAQADRINHTAVLLPRDASEPPTIELDDVAISAYVRLNEAGFPVVSLNLITQGVDVNSLLAADAGVMFELRVNYATAAGGFVSLTDGQRATVVAA